MGQTSEKLRISLSVKECAKLFERAANVPGGMGSRFAGLVAKSIGNDAVSFYNPIDDSPLAQFEDDAPTFLIGCRIARMGSGGAAANPTDIQMSVWDRGPHRDVVFISEFRVGAKRQSAKAIRFFVESFLAADRTAKIG